MYIHLSSSYMSASFVGFFVIYVKYFFWGVMIIIYNFDHFWQHDIYASFHGLPWGKIINPFTYLYLN